MHKVCWLLMLVASIVTTAQAKAANDSAQDWLERMSRAAQHINYQGYVVFGKHKQWQTMSIAHGVIDGVVHEKIVYLNGPQREFIRHGTQVMCLEQNAPTKHWSRPKGGLPESLLNIDKTPWSQSHLYRAQLESQERVAGRMTQVVYLTPSDEYRYGHRFWLDKDSGLLLRSEMLDQNAALERYQFVSVNIDIIPRPDLFKPSMVDTRAEQHTHAKQTAQTKHMYVPLKHWLPSGFNEVRTVSLPNGMKTLFSDGLASLTVFMEEASNVLPAMDERMGSTSVSVRYLTNDNHTYRLTVVGEVTTAATRKIAMSIAIPN